MTNLIVDMEEQTIVGDMLSTSKNNLTEHERGEAIQHSEVESFIEQELLNCGRQTEYSTFYSNIESLLPNIQQVVISLSPLVLYYFSYSKASTSAMDIGGMDLFFDFSFL
jgi:hypothetical protein